MNDDSAETVTPQRPPRPPKPPKTPEDLAAIALLDRLRRGEGETKPTNLPLACVVRVVDYCEIPKANERYAMATVEGRDGRTWRLCVLRYYLEKGMRAVFVSEDAALPANDERFVNPDVCKLHERVYRFGFGVKIRCAVPFVKRNIYLHNCGVLYPLDDFHELLKASVGDVCAAALHIESAEQLHRLAMAPHPKPKAVPPPPSPQKDDFLAKLRLHRKRYGY